MKIKLVATFTESPSFNVRVLDGDSTIFYNSERLCGNERTIKVGKILGITTLPVGEYDFDITQEQYNQICDIKESWEK